MGRKSKTANGMSTVQENIFSSLQLSQVQRISSEDGRKPSDQAEEAEGDRVWKRTKDGSTARLSPTGVAVSPSSGWVGGRRRACRRMSFCSRCAVREGEELTGRVRGDRRWIS